MLIQKKLQKHLKESKDAINIIESKIQDSSRTKFFRRGFLALLCITWSLMATAFLTRQKKIEDTEPWIQVALLGIATLMYIIENIKHQKKRIDRRQTGRFDSKAESYGNFTPDELNYLTQIFDHADQARDQCAVRKLLQTGRHARQYSVFFQQRREILTSIISGNNQLNKALFHKTQSPLKHMPRVLVDMVSEYAYEDISLSVLNL